MRVAHVRSPFLGRSETFLYGYVANHQRYLPVVIAEYLENAHQFPVEEAIVHRSGPYRHEAMLDRCRSMLFDWHSRELVFRAFYRRALASGRFDVAHFHFGPPAVRLCHLAGGMPVVVSFYGYDLSQVPHRYGLDFYQRTGLFGAATLVTAEGRHAAACLTRLGCPPEKVRIVHVGVDVVNMPFRPRGANGSSSTQILFCGRFVAKKGLDIALRALAAVARAGHAFEFVVIGDCALRESMHRLTAELGLSDRTRFVGSVDHADFKRWCERCDVLLAPSRTDSQTGDTEGGSPTVILEAAASGMPIVSTTHADIPDVVSDGESGWLAREGDEASLAAKLIEALTRHDRWPAMGAAGRERVVRLHDIRAQTAVLERVYDEARHCRGRSGQGLDRRARVE